jgi:hypothetical protein
MRDFCSGAYNPDLDGEKGAVGDDFQLVVAR